MVSYFMYPITTCILFQHCVFEIYLGWYMQLWLLFHCCIVFHYRLYKYLFFHSPVELLDTYIFSITNSSAMNILAHASLCIRISLGCKSLGEGYTFIYTHTHTCTSMIVELLGPRAIFNYSGYFLIVFQSIVKPIFTSIKYFIIIFSRIVCSFETLFKKSIPGLWPGSSFG